MNLTSVLYPEYVLIMALADNMTTMKYSGNITTMAAPQPTDDIKMFIYETIIATILAISTAFSLILNLILILVFVRYSCLRTKHDVIAINLAITNFIISFGISFYSTYSLNPGDIHHVKFVCLSFFIFIFGGILASLFILLFLALERYLCIVYPAIHRQIGIRHIYMCSFIAYLFGALYIAIPFHFKNKWERYHLCVADVYPLEFSITEQILGILIILVIFLINSIVFKTAMSHAARINALLRNVQNIHSRKRKRQKGKAFVTVFLLSGISALCWVPLLVVFGFESDPTLTEKTRWLLTQLLYVPVSFNSSITAFIIGYRNKHFRDAISSTLCKRKHECNRRITIYI